MTPYILWFIVSLVALCLGAIYIFMIEPGSYEIFDIIIGVVFCSVPFANFISVLLLIMIVGGTLHERGWFSKFCFDTKTRRFNTKTRSFDAGVDGDKICQ